MYCPACLKRVLLVLPKASIEAPWSDAERERPMTLVELEEATRLLGAKVADLTALGHRDRIVSVVLTPAEETHR